MQNHFAIHNLSFETFTCTKLYKLASLLTSLLTNVNESINDIFSHMVQLIDYLFNITCTRLNMQC